MQGAELGCGAGVLARSSLRNNLVRLGKTALQRIPHCLCKGVDATLNLARYGCNDGALAFDSTAHAFELLGMRTTTGSST
jgi:hypothetical protein